MRAPLFTDEEVITAGYEIKNDKTKKKRVTGQALSNQLGGGRPDRLLKIWESHISQEDVVSSEKLDLPTELENFLEEILDKVSLNLRSILVKSDAHINELANKRIEKEKAWCAEQANLLEEKLADADSVINKNEDSIDDLIDEIKTLEPYKHKAFEFEKLVIELQTKLEAYENSIIDKNRIITEQEARIVELKKAA
tara:strand:- start:1660 stop:2247 length:588 start_codon:yes stop_codon:yes gene_type:complete